MGKIGRPEKPISERFLNKYAIRESGCWEWIGAKDKTGYGFIKRKDGVQLRAHRVSWEIHRGEIPEGLFVCHKCDNHQCVNPGHLFLGTNSDNIIDAISKGRKPSYPGELNKMSKLTESDVVKIIGDKREQRTIAAEYGINQTTVSQIKLGKRWKYLQNDSNGSYPKTC